MSYFAVPSFESLGGRALAVRIVEELDSIFDVAPTLNGMRLPVLRETRMPAVLCSLGPVRSVVDRSDLVSTAVTRAVTSWSESPVSPSDEPTP